MKRRLSLLSLAVLGVVAFVFAGCPDGKPMGHLEPEPVTPIATGTAVVTSALTWAEVAERVAVRLDETVKGVDAGDKKAALEAFDKAYFEEYEGEAHNLEVESRKNLEPELDDGKKQPVVFLREDSFAQIKAAVSHGAPSGKVRELVDTLLAKIRDDARKLDSMH
jgi:hypothetical protein